MENLNDLLREYAQAIRRDDGTAFMHADAIRDLFRECGERQRYSKEWCTRMAALEPEDGVPPAGLAASAPTSDDVMASTRYVVIAYGESDHPQAALVSERGGLLDAVLGMMYTNPSDAQPDVREAYRRDIADDDEWSEGIWRTEFEIGGIVIYDLGGEVPQPVPAVAQPGLTFEHAVKVWDAAMHFDTGEDGMEVAEYEKVRDKEIRALLSKGGE